MCGICGAVGNWNPDKIRALLILNQDRGRHATGFWNGQKLCKKACDAEDFLSRFHDELETKTPFIVCHTRYATSGDQHKDKHAHPFRVNNIVGVHNGIIREHESKQKFPVDSQYLIEALNDGPAGLNTIEGYWACVFTDQRKPNTVGVTVNGGELHCLQTEGAIYFSSTMKNLETVFGAKADIRVFSDGDWAEIDTRTGEMTLQKIALKPPNKTKTWQGCGYNAYEDVDWGSWRTGKKWADIDLYCPNCGGHPKGYEDLCSECGEKFLSLDEIMAGEPTPKFSDELDATEKEADDDVPSLQ